MILESGQGWPMLVNRWGKGRVSLLFVSLFGLKQSCGRMPVLENRSDTTFKPMTMTISLLQPRHRLNQDHISISTEYRVVLART